MEELGLQGGALSGYLRFIHRYVARVVSGLIFCTSLS